jgi:hypothetical protein
MEDDMKFIYDDGGRAAAGFKGDANDCVVRAVAIATGQPYRDVYAALSDGCREQRKTKRSKTKASARNGVNTQRQWFKDYMKSLGWKWTPTMRIGTGCRVHLHDGELPMGRLIVAVSKHYTTVIDGVIHDTYDPQRNRHVIEITPEGQTFKISRRCVYGYWAEAS